MPLPPYLYHSAPIAAAKSISITSLQARSGTAPKLYLCMSGVLAGATTLKAQASDIIFRVDTTKLTAAKWTRAGAGSEEWRGTEDIPAANLTWRRRLGTAPQTTFGRTAL